MAPPDMSRFYHSLSLFARYESTAMLSPIRGHAIEEVYRCKGTEYVPGRQVKVSKTKTATRETQEFSFAELSCP